MERQGLFSPLRFVGLRGFPSSRTNPSWQRHVRTRPKEQKFWFLIKGHSKGLGETFLPLYNSVFISLPGYVYMFILRLWDTSVSKKASITGQWAQVPSWVKTHGSDPLSHEGFGFFSRTSLTLYFLWSVPICYILPTRCPHDSCGLMSAGILLLRNVLAAANPGGNTVHSLQAEMVPKAQEPGRLQPSDPKSFCKGAWSIQRRGH